MSKLADWDIIYTTSTGVGITLRTLKNLCRSNVGHKKLDEIIEQITDAAYEQGKRDLFEEAERLCGHYGHSNNRWVKRCCDECWQSLKEAP